MYDSGRFCPRCKLMLPIEEFRKYTHGYNYCRGCQNALSMASHTRHGFKNQKAYICRHRDAVLAWHVGYNREYLIKMKSKRSEWADVPYDINDFKHYQSMTSVLRFLVRRGSIVKPQVCSHCGVRQEPRNLMGDINSIDDLRFENRYDITFSCRKCRRGGENDI